MLHSAEETKKQMKEQQGLLKIKLMEYESKISEYETGEKRVQEKINVSQASE